MIGLPSASGRDTKNTFRWCCAKKGSLNFCLFINQNGNGPIGPKFSKCRYFPVTFFCSTNRSSIAPILMTGGVIDVVRAGTNPLCADRAEIEALQQTVSVDVPLEAWPYTEVGERGSFSILRGPLAGLTGILVEVRSSQRLILSVSLLRRSVLVGVTA
jgi:hypothetical protein